MPIPFSVMRLLFLDEFFFYLNVKLVKLFFRNFRRRFAHGVDSVLRLREGDDIADGLAFEHEHDHAVQAEGQASVRGSAVFEARSRKPNFCSASSGVRPIALNTRCCKSGW